MNWDESPPPPHEHVIQKPLRCNRSRTCSHTEKTDFNTARHTRERSAKAGTEKPLRRVVYLHRVQATAATEGEATDVCGFWVPAGVQGTREEVPDLWENLLDHSTVGTNTDPLAELWSHVKQQTLWTGASASPLRPPELQLGLQRSQLEETGLLVQQREFLQCSNNQHNVHSDAVKKVHSSVDHSHALTGPAGTRRPENTPYWCKSSLHQ